jgi:hypothetical protein
MFTAKQYRAKSNAYGELSRETVESGQIRKYKDSSDSFSSLADNEDWLAGNLDKTLRATDEKQCSYGGFIVEKEHAPVPKGRP